MKKLRSLLVLTICLTFVFIPASCLATDRSILQADNLVSVGFGLLRMQYGETYSGYSDYLDTETGNILSLVGERSVLADDRGSGPQKTFFGIPLFPGGYASLRLVYSDGSTLYNGYTFSGVAISTTDLDTILKGDLSLGRSYSPVGYLVLIPKVDLGIQNWKRVSNPNYIYGGINYESVEIYRHLSAGAGLKCDIRISEGNVLSIGFDLLQNFNSNMTSSYDGNHYELGNNLDVRANAKLTFEVSQDVNLFGAVDYETFRYGISDVAPNGFLEPDSKTAMTLYTFGFAYYY